MEHPKKEKKRNKQFLKTLGLTVSKKLIERFRVKSFVTIFYKYFLAYKVTEER